MHIGKTLTLIGMACLSGTECYAYHWKPEVLEANATVICSGKVLSMEEGQKVDPSVGDVMVRAKVKILHVFKGQAPAEMEVRFREYSGYLELQGPVEVELRTGQRYRFFLTAESLKHGFIGVRIERNDAALLGPNEPDNNSYLPEKDAIAIAQDYARSKHLEDKVNFAAANALYHPYFPKGAAWGVRFFPNDGTSPEFVVAIHMDRTIDSATSGWQR